MTNDFIDDAIDLLNKDGREYILVTASDTGVRYTAYIEDPDNMINYMKLQGFDMILDMLEESKK